MVDFVGFEVLGGEEMGLVLWRREFFGEEGGGGRGEWEGVKKRERDGVLF